MGGSGITVNQLKSYLGDDWTRKKGSIESKLVYGSARGKAYNDYIDEGKKMYEIIKKIKENETLFFDNLYAAVNSNNEFTDEPNGRLRNSYFNNTKMPTLSDFKERSIKLIEYDNLINLRKQLKDMSLEHMTNLESQVGGGKMIYIPQSKKRELATLLLEAEGIKKQFIIRSVEVLKQMDPDYFEINPDINPDIINKALEIYIEGHGKEGLLKILEKVIDNTNDYNYKDAFRNIKTNLADRFFSHTQVGKIHKEEEEAGQGTVMSGMFGDDDY